MLRCATFLVVLALALPAVADRAWAGTASRQGDVIRWDADDGEADRVTARIYQDDVVFMDPAGITVGSGCREAFGGSPTEVLCSTTGMTGLVLDGKDLDDVLHCDSSGVVLPCSVVGGAGNDQLTGDRWVTATLEGGPGDDRLGGGLSPDTLLGGPGNDILTDDFGTDLMDGGADDDTLFPGEGHVLVDGGDDIRGGPGHDTLDYFAANGDRTITFDGVADDGLPGENDNVAADIEDFRGSNGADTVTGTDGPNDLDGRGGADVLDGAGGPDTLHAHGDTLIGGAGDDVFDESVVQGGPFAPINGNDIMQGGTGSDTVDYGNRTAGVHVDSDGVADDGDPTVYTQGGGSFQEHDNVGADVERALGGAGADTLQVVAPLAAGGDDILLDLPGPQQFDGGPGTDLVSYAARGQGIQADADGAAGDDGATGEGDTIATSVESLTGGSAGDTLTANGAAGTLSGGAGADTLSGAGGNDRLIGDAGDDTLKGDADDDTLLGGAGDDTLAGGAGRDRVDYSASSAAVDAILDGQPNDGSATETDNIASDVEDVTGGGGDDLLIGSGAGNRLLGGSGDDLLDGGAGPDLLDGQADDDTVDYSERSGAVALDLGANGPQDGGASDGLPGARDDVRGIENAVSGAGNDTLTGDGRDNFLDGGTGRDTIAGGAGLDAVFYDLRSEPVTAELSGAPVSGSAADGAPGARDALQPDLEDLIGGSGPDRLAGNTLENILVGNAGDDVLDLRSVGSDLGLCGAGSDGVYANAGEDDFDACETLLGQPAQPGGSTRPVPTSGPGGARARLPRGQTLRSLRRNGLRVIIRCPASCRAAARLLVPSHTAKALKLPKRSRVLAKQSKRLSAGSATLRLRPGRAAARRLRRLRTLRATVELKVSVDGRGRQTLRLPLTLRRR